MKTLRGFFLGVFTTVVALAVVVLATGHGATVTSMALGRGPLLAADGAPRVDGNLESVLKAVVGGDGSSRDKAVPLGGSGTVDGWDFRVNGTTTRATFPGEESLFTPQLRPGETYLIVDVTGTYRGAAVSATLQGMKLEYVTPEGRGLGFERPYFFDAQLENALALEATVYRDGAVSGSLVVVVPEDETGGVLAVGPTFTLNQQVIFLATE
jgi:hypothetical protein